MQLIDTHAHIHFDEFKDNLTGLFSRALETGVESIITVGTDDVDSRQALEFVRNKEIAQTAKGISLYASVGIHPHDAHLGGDGFLTIKELVQNEEYSNKLVAIGECGLDYYKNLSSPIEQKEMLRWQIELAQECSLPLIFHVRDAWEDFFAIIKDYPKVRGVIHSFTGTKREVEQALDYNLHFGLNGIVTFTKQQAQLDGVLAIPKERIVLETDCPFLTPVPMRGKINEPGYMHFTAEFVANLRNEKLEEFSQEILANSNALFKLEK
ncbi:MAG: TatD family hydrolase [Candidatus Saccharibacteria bacterium]